MTDMTAFERQVADEMLGRAGPVRPVDDLAIFDSVTAASRLPRWGFTIYSALKFVTAAAIVALFGGFLLAGILTTQQDGEALPAAVTESPEPETTTAEPDEPVVRTDILPGVTLNVVEVEPGVFRVINDGVRDLSLGRGVFWASIVAGHDGSVWVWAGEPDGTFRLGHEATYPWTLGGWIDEADFEPNPSKIVVGPDGTVWYRHWRDQYLYRFDGEAWTVDRLDTRVDAVAVGPDGRLWATRQGKHVERRVDGEWETVADMPDGDDDAGFTGGMAVTDDGDIWLWSVHPWFGIETSPTVVHHFDGRTRQSLDLPDGDVGHAAFGQDGTVWWAAGGEGLPRVTAIHRFDGDEWQRFDAAEGWPDGMKHVEVAPDGRLWVFPFQGPGGAYLFDGDVWTPYLDDVDIPPAPQWRLDGYVVGLAGDMAPDGSAWVLAADTQRGSDDEVGLYVITPEAVAATE